MDRYLIFSSFHQIQSINQLTTIDSTFLHQLRSILEEVSSQISLPSLHSPRPWADPSKHPSSRQTQATAYTTAGRPMAAVPSGTLISTRLSLRWCCSGGRWSRDWRTRFRFRTRFGSVACSGLGRMCRADGSPERTSLGIEVAYRNKGKLDKLV